MDGLTLTIIDDVRDRSLEVSGRRRVHGAIDLAEQSTPKRWNLADELARRRSRSTQRSLPDAVPPIRSGATPGRPAIRALSSLAELPPAWPLDGWRESVADPMRTFVHDRLAALASLFASPRWHGAQPRTLMFGVAISVGAAVALTGWRTDAAPVLARSPSVVARIAAPVRQSLPPPIPVLAAMAPTSKPLAASAPVAQGPATPAFRPFADVSTMDLMMPIAEPDLDISSGRSLWAQVGKSTGVDPLLLYSIALVESKALNPDGNVVPTPWLFRVDDHVVRGDRQDVQLAMAAASQFGSAVQDVGIMQVYYPMHRDAVRDPLSLLNPRTNITVAAKILREGMRQTRDHVLGVGYYHSHTPALARDYGTLVLSVYQRLKAIHRPAADQEIVAG
ncbi:MAG: transglycosylase SLT domain-containing protein [Rhodanobacter sp.]